MAGTPELQWKFNGYRALQPSVVGDDTILLPTPMNLGTRAIRIKKTDGQLATEELWTSRSLKPDFTDFVIHQGHAYGIDGGIFTCVDLTTGQRKWKGGRYGKGQALLLENSGLFLVAAEDGQVCTRFSGPDEYKEVASFKHWKERPEPSGVIGGPALSAKCRGSRRLQAAFGGATSRGGEEFQLDGELNWAARAGRVVMDPSIDA